MNNWNVYPRPSLKREGNFAILNDGWTLNGFPINLPFPPEAPLSDFKGELSEIFVYTKDFEIPLQAQEELKNGGKLILHFGAVDQVCTIFADEQAVGHSELGYFAINCDITEPANQALASGKNTLSLKVEGEDYLDHNKPYGKQRKDRGGMWYTPVTGIWQTVWCEWVSSVYISKISYKTSGSVVDISVWTEGTEGNATSGNAGDKGDRVLENVENTGDRAKKTYVTASKAWQSIQRIASPAARNDKYINGDRPLENTEIQGVLKLAEGDFSFTVSMEQRGQTSIDLSKIEIDGKKHQIQFWSAENPYLYQVEFTLGEDKVQSYFALRTVSICKVDEINRICINNQPVFLNGVLDQGYFEKGLFVPENPSEYEKDILRMKELGFNTLRKHIKIEPEIFYYECDRLGMYVMQDMVNNGPYNFMKDTVLATLGLKINDKNRYKNQEQKDWFKISAFETQNFLNNHPCVVGYTVFNEGWGQTDSDEIGDELKAKDPTRFYDYTSGWFEQKHSDVESVHIYFRTKNLKPKAKPMILSEFGGFTRAVENHIWNTKKSYGYGKCENESDLTARIIETYEKMVVPAIPKGLCGAIYTQLSDIEDEINGFYTYDREICKVDKEKIRQFMNSKIFKNDIKVD